MPILEPHFSVFLGNPSSKIRKSSILGGTASILEYTVASSTHIVHPTKRTEAELATVCGCME